MANVATGTELITEILERSASLTERRGESFTPPSDPTLSQQEEAAARFARWRKQVPRGNAAFFSRRLAWDGLDEDSATRLFLRPTYCGEALPAWAQLLEAVLEANRTLPAMPGSAPLFGVNPPIAFEEILLPFVDVAAEHLQTQGGALLDPLTPQAWLDLRRGLANTLAMVGERTLYADFSGWRAVPELAPRHDPARPLYSSYVAYIRRGGLDHLFRDYPVLARLLATVCVQWIANSEAFLRHWQQDRETVCQDIFAGKDPGPMVRLGLGLSDRHNGGKTVIEVEFGDGLSCFYKPRDCRPEMRFQHLLTWLAAEDPRFAMVTYKVVDRGDRGWAQKVPAAPCEGRDAARRFFYRSGLLTAVLYMVEASDCTADNILVAGDCPVLIDGETLLQPRPSVDEGEMWKAVASATEEMYYDSVLRLHILPTWSSRGQSEKIDMSALGGGRGGKRGTTYRKLWTDINADEMKLRWEQIPYVPKTALEVTIDGRPAAAEEFMDEILRGFSEMYRALMEQRESLWAADGPMRGFLDLPTRIVVRNTAIYFGLLNRLYEPRVLREGADAALAMDHLSWLFADSADRPLKWPIVAAESAAMMAADIPCFHVHSSSTTLAVAGRAVVPGYFREPAVELLPRRFQALSSADLDLQLRYIRSSFGLFSETSPVSEPLRPDSSGPHTADDYQGEALRLARAIRSQALRGSDNTTCWIALTYQPDAQYSVIQPVGMYLYDGIAGIALFLAALRTTTASDEFDDLLGSLVGMLIDVQSKRMRAHLERESVGAALGTASLAYTLARIAVFRGDDTVLETALGVVRALTPAMVAADRRLDLIGGSAGCLLVLRAIHSIAPRPWLLDQATLCGNRLLEAQSPSPGGLPAWQTIRGHHMLGFSHGAAGIACALAQLYQWGGDARFRAAAQQAVAYEDTLYSERENNWPNLLLPREDGGHDFWNSWCHGAPGIGLGRLFSRCAMDETVWRRDLDRALVKAGQLELTSLDTLCCGNFGRIELLIEAANALDEPQHIDRAQAIATAAMHRARIAGDFSVGVQDGIYVPSFFQGMAGIGYQLLRLAHPGQLPSVLRWE